jgi:anti-sigma factor RsiW
MTKSACERIALADLTDYAAGELSADEAAAIEEHLFSCQECGARLAEFDTLVRGIRDAMHGAGVSGFVTEEILNRFARDGIRVRSYALAPGTVVRCAVWEGDEVMALRLRGDFGQVEEVTVSQSVAGNEVTRQTGHIAATPRGELIFVQSAAWVRQLPVVEVQVVVTGHQDGGDRVIGNYTLIHEGSLHR